MTFSASGPGVRTHRRGGKGSRRPRKRGFIAPWIIVTAVSVLVLGLLTTGFVWLIKGSCSGDVQRATIVAAKDISGSLQTLARSWQDAEPNVDGQCVGVEIVEKDSSEVVNALGPTWDTRSDGDQPDAWVPESSAWAQMAENRDVAASMIPDVRPSLAKSGAVIAMPRKLAEALGWPDASIDWPALVEMAGDSQGWGAHGHEEWGEVKIGMTNPLTSTAGLLALLAITDGNGDGKVDDDELGGVIGLKDSLADGGYKATTDEITAELAAADAEGQGLTHLSAFPALETDVLGYNAQSPAERLVAVYPADGSTDADHPFIVLENTPWFDGVDQQTAQQFLEYARGDVGREEFQEQGFRDFNREGGSDVNDSNGLSPQIAAPERGAMAPESVAQTVATWTALNRKTNLLFVMDTSEPMGQAVTVNGENTTLLEMATDALGTAVSMIGGDSSVGLWEFSGGYSSGNDWSELQPITKVTDDSTAALRGQIDGLQAGGPTGLYDTTMAAFEQVTGKYDPEAVNMVVILSGGANNDTTGGLDLETLTSQLSQTRDPNKPVSIVAIGYGENAPTDELQQIATATQGHYFPSDTPEEISRVLLNALFNVL